MIKFFGAVVSVTFIGLLGLQLSSATSLYACAEIPLRGCRFSNLSSDCPSVCSYFFDAIEAALVSDKSALYTLQRAFFPEGEQRPNVVDIYITLILNQVVDLPCDSELNDFRDASIDRLSEMSLEETCRVGLITNRYNCTRREYRWHHVWTSAVLTNVIERESLGLISSINTVAYITRLYSESQTSIIIATQERLDFQPKETAFIELNVPNLFCLPNSTEATLRSAWEDILPWIHGYTQKRGRIFFSDFERAFIFEDSNIDPDSVRIFGSFLRREVSKTVFVPYLISVHVLLQVAIGLTIMKLIPWYYSSIGKKKKGKRVKNSSPSSSVSIFWANVFFAFILDVLFVILDLYLLVSVYGGVDSAIDDIITSNNRSSLETVFAFGLLGTLVTFILVILQFLVAAVTPKHTEFYVPGLFKLLCCFFPCQCKKAGEEFWHKVLQMLAIWSLMVFLQLVTGSVIPYLVLAIVNPVPSVTFLALGASTLFCLIMFVASLIHVGVQVRIKKSSVFEMVVAVVQGLVFVIFLGLVAITVIIYQGVIQSGTSTGFVTGIALSLIPSAIIAILGVAVKFKLLSDPDDEDEEDESLLTRASSLIRHKLRSSKRRLEARNLTYQSPDNDITSPSDHSFTENVVELKKLDDSSESNDDENEPRSNEEAKEHEISKAHGDECERIDPSDAFGADVQESGSNDPPTTDEVENDPEVANENEVFVNSEAVAGEDDVVKIDLTTADPNTETSM